ncbi:uncharacterized protein LOC117589448 isoform X1 [Drosophila guanche]|uniref:Blast:Fibrillin-1 n=1 Tax=Drosophila guanche TaxID=7266 RepID=A0A3B0KSW2_DROGU|nr:uncharacterized protein LOC117589448 isoform X1 [Drosophila guanche]SPP86978.1 blast:Fibrillin-1 [Drosophila guanche]
MWAFKYVLCALTCVAFAAAAPEDCEVAPLVRHATAKMALNDDTITAIYNCKAGFELRGAAELICNAETDKWQGEPPTCVKASAVSERKKRVLAIPEEPKVPLPMAAILDMSCIEAKVMAPEISHGLVVKYERRRRGEKIFLVAYFACNENYEFESLENSAMYCHEKQWVGELPTCIPLVEYTDADLEDEDYDEYETITNGDGNTEDFGEGETKVTENEPPPPPPPPVEEEVVESVEELTLTAPVELPVVAEPQPEAIDEPQPEPEIVVRVDEAEPAETPLEPEVKVEELAVTEDSAVVEPTKDPYAPRFLDEDCGEDRGGCEHICSRLLYPDENEPVLKCSCREGYTLDPSDYVSCLDIDECQESNGGCSEICNNLPGSFQCACQQGYQIDTSTGKTCVDIDECANAELSGDCQNGCENLPGSYRCVVPLVTQEEAATAVSEPTEEDNEIPVEVEPSSTKVKCNPGFQLSPDGSECQDIDECKIENGEEEPHLCQQECHNTIGSYRCGCHPGYHLLEDQQSCALDGCEDLDNPKLNRTRCAHECEDLPDGQYKCKCPQGYDLAEDRHSCVVAESPCTTEHGHDSCRPGSCVPSEDNSSFSCLCPPGYTSELFSCQDIDECAEESHLCSHSCFNTDGGYQCLCPVGLTLVEEFTCVAEDLCEVNNNGCEQICLTARGGACSCRDGFRLGADGKSCQDIDECLVENGGCQQVCRNLPGTHACACERGYELSADARSCQDIDECAGLLSGGCTHECINKNGSFECGCPLGYILEEDNRSCRPALVGCPPGSQQTSDGCEPIKCGLGLLLGADGSCVDVDECQLNNGGCSHRCENSQGSFQCACPAGYQLDGDLRTCQDVDECSLDTESCVAGSCVNEPGGFRCECGLGKRLSIDGRTCLDVPQPPRASPIPELPKANPFPTFPELPKARPDERLTPALPVLPKANPFPTFPSLNKAPKYPSAAPEAPRLPSFVSVNTRLPQIPRIPWVSPSQPQPRDACPRFQAPVNGKARCNKYRHKRTQFYNSRCRVTCNPGFTLQGSEIRSCGSAGIWEGQENKCVPLVQRRVQICPALKPAANGFISPASCTQGPSRIGTICRLQCNSGFLPTGPMLANCMGLQGWSFGSQLNCQPFGMSFFNNNQLPWIRSQSLQNVPPVQQAAPRAQPYIKCPENVVILLHRGEVKAHVTLQRPQTNVDYRYVAVSPAWAKQLEAHLPAGVHKIAFRAQHPQTMQSAACQTIITIKAAPTTQSNLFTFSSAPVQSHSGFSRTAAFPTFSSRSSAPAPAPAPAPFPTFSRSSQFARLSALPEPSAPPAPVSYPKLESEKLASAAPERTESFRVDLGSDTSNYCPPSIEVHLKENQNLRSVVWEEPRFEGKLLKIFKSHFPGALFRLGNHAIKYEATTTDGVTLSCSFHIHVKAAKPAPAPAQPDIAFPESESAAAQLREKPASSSSLFDGHGSYVVCPDKEPVRVTAHQSVNLPVGCTLKNVRPQTSPQTQVKRGTLTSLWHRYNTNF